MIDEATYEDLVLTSTGAVRDDAIVSHVDAKISLQLALMEVYRVVIVVHMEWLAFLSSCSRGVLYSIALGPV